jgi:hypothetical protein
MTPPYIDKTFGDRCIGYISDRFPFASPRNPTEAGGFEAFRYNNDLRTAVAFTKAIQTAITDYDKGKRYEPTIDYPPQYSTEEVSARYPFPWATEGNKDTYWRQCWSLRPETRPEWDKDILASIADWERTQAEKTSNGFDTGTDETHKSGARSGRRTRTRARRRRILESSEEEADAVSRDEVVLNRKEERLKKDQRTLSRKAKRLSRKATKLSQWESELKQREREMQKKEASWSRRLPRLGLEKEGTVSDGEEGSDQSEMSTALTDITVVEE